MPEECAAAQAGVDASDVKYALEKLKKLEPCGCFAADLSECLLLQLERQGIGDEKLLYIVGERIGRLAQAADFYPLQRAFPSPLSGSNSISHISER